MGVAFNRDLSGATAGEAGDDGFLSAAAAVALADSGVGTVGCAILR